MSRFKVAHITTISDSIAGLLLNQLRSMQRAGYDVTAISSDGATVREIEAAGIRHIPVEMTRQITPSADLAALIRLYRVMRRERFTIVHTHTPKPGLLGQLAARIAGVPIVVNTVHGFFFHDQMSARARRFYITLETIAARCSDRILSQNQEDLQTAIAEGICRPDKIRHLGNGIDLARFSPDRIGEDEVLRRRAELGIPPGARIVGFVGRLAGRRKGFLDFLAAAGDLVRQGRPVRFLIVGDADLGKPDAISPEAARDFGVAEHCHFLGQRPNAELPALYRLMDVLVLPSLFEGIPRVVMEAAMMGVPAVVTDVKGNREAVQHGQNGLLVRLGDVPGLADAIATLLDDPARLSAMSQTCRRTARERFDERHVFETVLSEYAHLLSARGLISPEPRPLPKVLT
jgi:glycosyltransferase involved in cell wall biosynthesis